MKIEKNKSLKELNTFGIEAKALEFAEYTSVEELQELICAIQVRRDIDANYRVLHIGGGSNLLFFNDFNGMVIHNAIKGIELVEEYERDIVIRVGGGVVWDDLVAETLERRWYGLENLSLIPGEVGASAVQNIGAYGVEAKDYITKVELVDLYDGTQRVMTNEECEYGYRYSIFKSDAMRGRYAVTYVHYRLSKSFEPHLTYGGLAKAVICQGIEQDKLTAKQLRQIIIDTRNAKLPDPKVLGNGGSFFMNPIIPRTQYADLLKEYPTAPHYDVDDEHVKVPAGWLIEQAGWKGRSLGRAGVYEKQALVLVNRGGCTGQDVVALSDAIRADVRQQFGIDIHPEVNFI